MDSLRGIESFIKAVQAGSIAGGARAMGISPGAASQNIARLEQKLGARLLTRTTRSLSLTESGQLYFERVQELMSELELASQAVGAIHDELRGRLVIASSRSFARHVVAPILPGFNHKYPNVTVELIATDRSVDHITESIDVSIRSKPALELGLVARRLAVVPSVFCASPDYLERSGYPTEPEHLLNHDCLVFRLPMHGRFSDWEFRRDGEIFNAKVNARIISDDIDSLTAMAVAGGGITRLAEFIAEPLIKSGQLVELFRSTRKSRVYAEVEPIEFFLCVSDRFQYTPKAKALFEYLQSHLPEKWGGR